MRFIILGNGFDIANNLPTKYEDFFDFRKETAAVIKKLDAYFDIENIKSFPQNNLGIRQRIDSFIKELDSYGYEDITFWDIYFISVKKSRWIRSSKGIKYWNELEKEIKDFLIIPNEEEIKISENTKRCFNLSKLEKSGISERSINDIKNGLVGDIAKKDFSDTEIGKTIEKLGLLIAMVYLNKNYYESSEDRYLDAESLIPSLLEELNLFETVFQNYISLMMSLVLGAGNTTDKRIYRDNFAKIIREGVCDIEEAELLEENQDENDIKKEVVSVPVFLLNFNFTSITTAVSDTEEGVKAKTIGKIPIKRKDIIYDVVETNVHGNFDSVAIFGIDQKDIDSYLDVYSFTKTFRKISEHKRIIGFALPHPSTINEIIFYGHSLSEADYSYFQSIFDYYDIYRSNICLTFLFSVYGEAKYFQSIRTKKYREVTQLFGKYGETMSNPELGKNLIHKMLLENRLHLKEIEMNSGLNTLDFREKYLITDSNQN